MNTNLQNFSKNKEQIIEATLKLIPKALSGDRANRSFFITNDERIVDYSYYLGQISLGDKTFFTIKDHQTLDSGDYGYKSDDDMFEDAEFLNELYRDVVTYAIEEHIMKLELI
jgi:hypothetical protein